MIVFSHIIALLNRKRLLSFWAIIVFCSITATPSFRND